MVTSSNNHHDDQDDVVVIEERDNKTVVYIAVAAILGMAFGGLLGSHFTAKKWEANYQTLEQQYKSTVDDRSKLVANLQTREAELDKELDARLESELAIRQKEHQAEIEKLQNQLTEMEKLNIALEGQLKTQQSRIDSTQVENEKLNRQADMQANMFERSRELFRREMEISQDLEKLEKEREALVPAFDKLKSECEVYLAGKSWDAKSDACDKQDEASSRLSQIDQLIEVYKMDLKQIRTITQDLGLQ
ncbi:chromosome partitioning protein ParA [Vibrio vulnificus]|uniref:Chromosome partitioning protein ParA n=1 Tax=Vibrio vulnificus TaxID=672 RepID=A0A8H9K9V5_VIBVL|nr:chromosome partitioning protein ParA [Vibrio vulnificus]EGQ7991260.1 chromosome partitioning protein ParA [Vibrio vulnificus]EGQ7997663.1 chromosome partitioning protein ParA [Vibrio vulnificus]EGQ8022911.1 chromosome partitioning protein ParA [Vibrio vulnificus]EGQ9291287.1 chromosome partitioning protein ParA [Vibrio vulnificus]EGQ9933902.1 chromosome partitioning protein ParA [Vibrio vulnificus]